MCRTPPVRARTGSAAAAAVGAASRDVCVGEPAGARARCNQRTALPPAHRIRPRRALPLRTRSPAAQVSAKTADGLIAPHGGKLVNLMLADSAKAAAVASCNKTIECSDRNACDVELLTVG